MSLAIDKRRAAMPLWASTAGSIDEHPRHRYHDDDDDDNDRWESMSARTYNLEAARAFARFDQPLVRPTSVRAPSREPIVVDHGDLIEVARPDARRSRSNRDSQHLGRLPRQSARQSLVDNMLSSLDRLESDVVTSPIPKRRSLNVRSYTVDETQLYRATFREGRESDGEEEDDRPRSGRASVNSRFSTVRPARPRGHTYSTSYSSDHDLSAERHLRQSALMGRGRRSNSGSNVQTSLQRIDSLRQVEPERGPVYESQRARRPPARPGRSTKSSTSSSFEAGYAELYGSTRWPTTFGRSRAASVDRIQTDRLMPAPFAESFSPSYRSPFAPEDDFDAAPTPVVHAGPSRPQSSRASVHSATTARRAFLGSSAGRKMNPRPTRMNEQTGSSTQLGSRMTSSHGAKANRLPTRPPVDDGPAPGPTVSFGKPELGATTPPPRPASKDRPGFFRRMFGSSGHGLFGGSHGSSLERPRGRRRRLGSAPAAVNVYELGDDHQDLSLSSPPPPLQKKTSFFRPFWGASTSREPRAPLALLAPPVMSHPDAHSGRPMSPVSSLRQVMDPYIASPPSSREAMARGREARRDGDDEDEHYWQQRVTAQEAILEQLERPPPPHHTRSEPVVCKPGPVGDLVSASASKSRDGHRRAEVEMKGGRERSDSYGQSDESRRRRGRRESPTGRNRQAQAKNLNHTTTNHHDSAHIDTNIITNPSAAEIDEDAVIDIPPTSRHDSFALSKSDHKSPPRSPGVPRPDSTVLGVNPDLNMPRPQLPDRWISATKTHQSNERSEKKTIEPPLRSGGSGRIWLEPTRSEEHLPPTTQDEIMTPTKANPSKVTDTISPTRTVHDQPKEVDVNASSIRSESPHQVTADRGSSINDCEMARRLFEGDASFLDNGAYPAAWLGEPGPGRARVRREYAACFEWANYSILGAMRELCSKLVLKAETQQVDRILDAVSTRWCECNPNHGFKANDVVHTICYSILLLNTDLYLADIEQKMTRNQFIKNTMPTIRRVAEDAAPDAFDMTHLSPFPRSRTSSTDPTGLAVAKRLADRALEIEDGRPSVDVDQPTRKPSRRRARTDDLRGRSPTPLGSDQPSDEGGLLVSSPFYGSKKAWEGQVELVLKETYGSIRRQQLPLGNAVWEAEAESNPVSNTLAVMTGNVLKRSPSSLSKAHSENTPGRGRSELQRVGSNGRWTSKNRPRPRLYQTASTIGSSRTSFDDGSSLWTPTHQHSWSKYSLNKTQTSMSVGSVGSQGGASTNKAYRQSVGFANALSQAFIRDDTNMASNSSIDERMTPLLEDETLGLAGAPWAKEGIVQHKHHLDSVDKRAKDRNWSECFAVVSKGYMRLFSFSKGSIRQRNKHLHAGAVVGGGNWTENADAVGSFLLRQTIASELPSPGYSKARPYVWALSFPTGAVHLFQVGTPEIVKEWVSTANYWSARLSKEPVVGGISNIEYGWGEGVVNQALLGSSDNNKAEENGGPPPSRSGPTTRPSLQGSMRSSFDHACRGNNKTMGDRVTISEWNPPQQSMVASRLGESEQLQALITYVKNIEKELQRHNELRSPMMLAFSPRSTNANKAMSNWERKSSYLLREIVKFRTYIDSLNLAKRLGEEMAKKKILENESKRGEGDEDIGGGGCEKKGSLDRNSAGPGPGPGFESGPDGVEKEDVDVDVTASDEAIEKSLKIGGAEVEVEAESETKVEATEAEIKREPEADKAEGKEEVEGEVIRAELP